MKALIVCTNHDKYPTKTNKTGLWFSELTHFYSVMARRRILMDIVSPLGGEIPIDERSLDMKDEVNAQLWKDETFRDQIKNSLKPSDVNPQEYRLIYYAGGHGAMWDLPENPELQTITREIYERGGIVTAVCHGVCGLLNVRLSDGSFLITDKYLTGFTNMEETFASLVSEVPFYLEDKLKERQAHFTKSLVPFMEYIEMDERLITGQNPNSARKVASKALEELYEK